MAQVFISYASADRERAKRLAEVIEGRGYSVWWDRQIVPGQIFDEVIEKALDQAKCVVVLWSSTSVISDWVKTEAAEAAKRKVLVPVLIDNVKIPLEFRRVQAADLTQWDGAVDDREFQKVISGIDMEMQTDLTPGRSAKKEDRSAGPVSEAAASVNVAADSVPQHGLSSQPAHPQGGIAVADRAIQSRVAPERPQQRTGKWALALFIVLLAIAGSMLWRRQEVLVKTPDVIGRPYDSAASELVDANLVPERQDQPSKDGPFGAVVAQTPAARTMQAQTTRVILTVAVPMQSSASGGAAAANAPIVASTADSTTAVKPAETVPDLEPQTPAPAEAAQPADRTSQFGVAIVFDPPSNVRESPNDSSNIVCSVRQKTTINILKSAGSWYTTDVCPGKIGYIHRSQLKFSE